MFKNKTLTGAAILFLTGIVFVGCTPTDTEPTQSWQSTTSTTTSSSTSDELTFKSVSDEANELCKAIDRADIFINYLGERLSYVGSSPVGTVPQDCFFEQIPSGITVFVQTIRGQNADYDPEEFYQYNQDALNGDLEVERLSLPDLGEKAYGFQFEDYTSIDTFGSQRWVNVTIEGGIDKSRDRQLATDLARLALSDF